MLYSWFSRQFDWQASGVFSKPQFSIGIDPNKAQLMCCALISRPVGTDWFPFRMTSWLNRLIKLFNWHWTSGKPRSTVPQLFFRVIFSSFRVVFVPFQHSYGVSKHIFTVPVISAEMISVITTLEDFAF